MADGTVGGLQASVAVVDEAKIMTAFQPRGTPHFSVESTVLTST